MDGSDSASPVRPRTTLEAGIVGRDPEALERFYTEAMGFRVVHRLQFDEFGTVLRLAGIYGPGRDRIVRMVKEGTARTGSLAFGNRIHQRDCAGALAHLLELDAPAPTYVGVDLAQDPLDTVYAYVAEQLGVPIPAAGDGDARSRGTGRKRCSSALLRQSGYVFRVPSYREGYREAIERMR